MIKSAEGPSPLEENLRAITVAIDARDTGSSRVARAAAWAVAALRRAGVDSVHTEKSAAAGPGESEIVIGEIRGREKPDEYVLLGTHLDLGIAGTVALDSRSNAALLIDAARVISSSGNIPRRSIRFVLFTDARQGEAGSRAYVSVHRAELDHVIAAINFDAGAGRVTGYSLGGRKDILVRVREALEPLKPLGPMEFTFDPPAASSALDFLLEGVPALTPSHEAAVHAPNNPAARGGLSKADITELKRNVAIAAVTAYALADAPERIGHRQSRAEIEQLLKDSGLDQAMKADGSWAAWENGSRGRQP
jgi:Peptidase family M28